MPRIRSIALLFAALLLGATLYSQTGARSAGGHIGVNLGEISADRAAALKLDQPRGVEIRSVQDGSPAETAGLRPGDVLLTYNGEEIFSAPQLGRLVSETPLGHRVKIQFWRDGKEKSTVVVPALIAEAQGPDPGPLVLDARALDLPNIPRPLMLWYNLALGIECEPIDSQLAQYFGVTNGILIRQVDKGNAGDRAGLKAGDVVTSIGTRTVAAPHDLISYLRSQSQPGKAMVIQIVRDKKPRTLTISLAE